ncbi:hypothetical protein QFC24_000542 [Naganishia onofrii]|uniref:Uncharacterized protein n=1 Tax=Naganishia onofrii TaxID=1851511 RepID=A0ACC2XXL8_9TREE|nr:hypothetical protein QFC24_000542 [Naganishia onofrii]
MLRREEQAYLIDRIDSYLNILPSAGHYLRNCMNRYESNLTFQERDLHGQYLQELANLRRLQAVAYEQQEQHGEINHVSLNRSVSSHNSVNNGNQEHSGVGAAVQLHVDSGYDALSQPRPGPMDMALQQVPVRAAGTSLEINGETFSQHDLDALFLAMAQGGDTSGLNVWSGMDNAGFVAGQSSFTNLSSATNQGPDPTALDAVDSKGVQNMGNTEGSGPVHERVPETVNDDQAAGINTLLTLSGVSSSGVNGADGGEGFHGTATLQQGPNAHADTGLGPAAAKGSTSNFLPAPSEAAKLRHLANKKADNHEQSAGDGAANPKTKGGRRK